MKSSTSWCLLVAEVLRHGEAGRADAHAGSRRLVHLAEDEATVLSMTPTPCMSCPEVVALAGALAHAAEDGVAAVLLGDVVDEFLNDHRLADARAAEEADLAALDVGAEQVDDLDAGLEHLLLGVEILERRSRAMDRAVLRSPMRPVSIGLADAR